MTDEIVSNFLNFFLEGLKDGFKDVGVCEYFDLVFEEIVLDLEVRVSIVIFDHAEVEV